MCHMQQQTSLSSQLTLNYVLTLRRHWSSWSIAWANCRGFSKSRKKIASKSCASIPRLFACPMVLLTVVGPFVSWIQNPTCLPPPYLKSTDKLKLELESAKAQHAKVCMYVCVYVYVCLCDRIICVWWNISANITFVILTHRNLHENTLQVSKQLGTDIRTRGTINEASNMVIQERDKAIEARDTAIQARDKAIQARDKANQEAECVKNAFEATKLWLMNRLRVGIRKNIPWFILHYYLYIML